MAACAFCGSCWTPLRSSFAIALASSGFLRSRLAFDAFCSQRLRNGTFISAIAIGRT